MKKLPLIVSGIILGLGLTIWLAGAAKHVAAGELGSLHPEFFPTDVFVTVDAVTAKSNWVIITGTLEGGNTVVTREYISGFDSAADSAGERCDRLALLALGNPGAYRFSVTYDSSMDFLDHCTLARNTP